MQYAALDARPACATELTALSKCLAAQSGEWETCLRKYAELRACLGLSIAPACARPWPTHHADSHLARRASSAHSPLAKAVQPIGGGQRAHGDDGPSPQ